MPGDPGRWRRGSLALPVDQEIEKVWAAGMASSAARAQREEAGSSLGGLPVCRGGLCKINGGSIFCFFPSEDHS